MTPFELDEGEKLHQSEENDHGEKATTANKLSIMKQVEVIERLILQQLDNPDNSVDSKNYCNHR